MPRSDHNLNGCRVFIVEDEHFLTNDLEEALVAEGARIIGPYSDFEAAYRRAPRDHFDVAIIDINLRDKAAYPIADELIRQRVPFVFCTGYADRSMPERFAGVKVWQKPFDLSKFVEDIEVLYRQ